MRNCKTSRTMRSVAIYSWTLLTWALQTSVTSSATTPPTSSSSGCGSLADISEILWEADTARMTFEDAKTLFPSLQDVTDASITKALSQADKNTLPDIIINLQASGEDLANATHGKLFQLVDWDDSNEDYQQSRNLLYTLYNYYTPVALKAEQFTDPKTGFIEEFLSDVTTSSNVIKELETYLTCRFMTSDTYFVDMFNLLFGIWFSPYKRYPGVDRAVQDSSGFENTFIGEFSLDGTMVSGLHSWQRLYRLQQFGDVDFPGSIELIEPNIVALTFTWDGHCQPQGSMFLGSSHEFEMAIYTLCFIEMPGKDCNVSLDGHAVTIRTEKVGLESPSSPFGQIKSAYPVVTVSRPCNMSSTPPRDCGSLTDISEILWNADTSRLSFEDAMTLFPDLTEYTDSSIAQAIWQAEPDSLPDIILSYSVMEEDKGNVNFGMFYQHVNTTKLTTEAYEKFQTLVDSYVPLPYGHHNYSYDDQADQEQYIHEFMDSLLRTEPMVKLLDYLQCEGLINSEEEFSAMVNRLWFEQYIPNYLDPQGSGFEGTFAGQFSSSGSEDIKVLGPHNWYRLYLLETAGEVENISYVGQGDPNVMALAFNWLGYQQPRSTVWMGSSPEFEIAVYTLCYLTSNSDECLLSLGGQHVKVVINTVTDYDVHIASAYPVVMASDQPTSTTTLPLASTFTYSQTTAATASATTIAASSNHDNIIPSTTTSESTSADTRMSSPVPASSEDATTDNSGGNGASKAHVGIRILALVLAAPLKVFHDRYQQLP